MPTDALKLLGSFALAGLIVFAVWRMGGRAAALSAAAAISYWFTHVFGVKRGQAAEKQKQAERDLELRDARDAEAKEAEDARIESDRVNADPDKLRKSDGFKRPS